LLCPRGTLRVAIRAFVLPTRSGLDGNPPDRTQCNTKRPVPFQASAIKGADHTNTKWPQPRMAGKDRPLHEQPALTLCTRTEHSFPPSPSRETCCDVPVRPRQLSSAVFSCILEGPGYSTNCLPTASDTRQGYDVLVQLCYAAKPQKKLDIPGP
jgi:hypothetical protein